jgi:hypothetical protein
MLDRIGPSVQKSFDFVGKALKTNTDPEIELYKTLKEADFMHLTSVYGADGVTDYIQRMEKKMMLGR